jgi:hypothetical protein
MVIILLPEGHYLIAGQTAHVLVSAIVAVHHTMHAENATANTFVAIWELSVDIFEDKTTTMAVFMFDMKTLKWDQEQLYRVDIVVRIKLARMIEMESVMLGALI